MAVHPAPALQRPAHRAHVLADRAGVRPRLQGDGRDQLRAGRVRHDRGLCRRGRPRRVRRAAVAGGPPGARRHGRVRLRPRARDAPASHRAPDHCRRHGDDRLAAILRGVGPLTWGAETKPLVLPISDEPFILGPLFVPPIQLLGASVSIVFLGVFGWFFLKSRKGIAMRAVADSQQVAMAMGINVERYFALAWAMTGVVSALGGVIWGSMLGVDVHLSLVGFKVFPVVILGGLDSVPGASLGGLIVGVVENVAAGYVDPYVGGGTKDFAPYVLMILALMIRPYGIFGKRIIERV